ncbi:hypothetical protein Btru_043538 [Bulinus truncatus]|nr:hypothetical protein Btru_043538 [Bulinus truncatus]
MDRKITEELYTQHYWLGLMILQGLPIIYAKIHGQGLFVQQQSVLDSSSDAGKGVLSAHVICTVFVIILSITAIVILFKSGDFNTYLILLYVSVIIFEIAQLILVIVSATSIDYNLNTSILFWIIMIIYQCLVNFVLIFVDCILLGIKTKCARSQQKTHLFKFLVALLCVHTIIGLIVLPFITLFVWICIGEKIFGNAITCT